MYSMTRDGSEMDKTSFAILLDVRHHEMKDLSGERTCAEMTVFNTELIHQIVALLIKAVVTATRPRETIVPRL